jgi:hypothetical protein
VQMLLSNRGPSSSSEPAPSGDTGQVPGGDDGRQHRHSMQNGLPAEAAPAALPHDQQDRYLMLLLQREVQRYAAQVCAPTWHGAHLKGPNDLHCRLVS